MLYLSGCEKKNGNGNPIDPNNGNVNSPPHNPSNYSPPDLYDFVIPSPYNLVRWIKLSWDCYDEDGDQLCYTLITFKSDSVENGFELFVKDTLLSNDISNYYYYHAYSGTHYWQVHVSDGEYVTKGPILSFRLTR